MDNKYKFNIFSNLNKSSLPLTSGTELTELRLYLEEILRDLPLTSKSQRTMICTWLCELYIHEISMHTLSKSFKYDPSIMNIFQEFLRMHRSSLDSTTTMQLLLSRGIKPLVTFYAQLVGDYDKVIYNFLLDRRYLDTITLLSDAPFERVESLLYNSIQILIEVEPEATVNMMLTKEKLKFSEVIPALLRYCSKVDACDANDNSLETTFDGRRINFAILYVEETLKVFTEDSSTSENLYLLRKEMTEFYLFLMVKYDSYDEKRLLAFLYPILDNIPDDVRDTDLKIEMFQSNFKKKSRFNYGNDLIYFDVHFIFNLCVVYNRQYSCVLLLAIIGSFDEAVSRAIHFDVELAKIVASKPFSLKDKKKMWCLIIEKTLQSIPSNERNDFVLNILHGSNDILQIDDVLKFLSDLSELDLFKNEICDTLESICGKIENLRYWLLR